MGYSVYEAQEMAEGLTLCQQYGIDLASGSVAPLGLVPRQPGRSGTH